MPGSPAISGVLLALYPLLIFVGLYYVDPRTLAIIALAALLLRHRRLAAGFVLALPAQQRAALALPIALSVAVVATNSEPLLLLYPAAVNASLLLLFGMTVVNPPTVIERVARLREPDLPPASVRYTRTITLVWCAFFALNGALAIYTALLTSREAWALYNGFIAYLLMGALIAGERLTRRRLLRSA
jgi:uncharacterized membrane protein